MTYKQSICIRLSDSLDQFQKAQKENKDKEAMNRWEKNVEHYAAILEHIAHKEGTL